VQSVRFVSQKPPTPPNKKVKGSPPPRAPPSWGGSTASASEPQRSTLDTQEAAQEPTLDAEQRSTLATGVPTLDFSPEPEKEFQRTGAKSSKDTLSSSEKKRRFMSRVSLALLALAFGAQTVYMGREWDDQELKDKKMVSSSMLTKFYVLNLL